METKKKAALLVIFVLAMLNMVSFIMMRLVLDKSHVVNLAMNVVKSTPYLYLSAIFARQYRKEKLRPSLILMLAYFLYFMSQLFNAIAFFCSGKDPSLSLFMFSFLIPGFEALVNFCTLVFLDALNRETTGSLKISIIVSVFSVMIIYALISPILTPESFALLYEVIWLLFMFTHLMTAVLFIYHLIRLVRQVPKKLQFFSRLLVTGGMGILSGLVFAIFSSFFKIIPMIPQKFILEIATAIGISAIVSFAFQPKLFHVLSFRVLRLTVFNTNTGIPLFTHTWKSKENVELIKDGLFSSMLQGISLIMKEAVKRGNVREIRLDRGILLIKKSEKNPVACVIVASQSSRTIRDQLNQFAKRFFREFMGEFNNIVETSQFKRASDFISQYFPFIPKYD